ncbi:MAG: pyridoxamine 5'-phosphate oxidase family protein [Anaerolineae bacterium]|nr:pyridoxamine 5'-phosphate oxidase family protein [Anaerolineae bacterium]
MSITLESIRETLNQPLVARLATLTADGYPHVVPLWYAIEADRDEIIVMTDRTARKAQNLLSNPHGAIQIGGDPAESGQGYTPGYLFQGDFSVETDAGHVVTERITRRYMSGKPADDMLDSWKDDDIVVLRLKVRRIIRVY